jgi:hypothetical protein
LTRSTPKAIHTLPSGELGGSRHNPMAPAG